MITGKAKKIKFSEMIGWAIAALCVAGSVGYIHNTCSKDLALMVYVDGEAVCKVQDREVVDGALSELVKKLEDTGMESISSGEITYKFVFSNGRDTVDSGECMDMLYNQSASDYSRAYLISVDGFKLGACATYKEAETIVCDFKEYIINKVLVTNKQADVVELTSNFIIESIFCKKDTILKGEEIYCALVSENIAAESGDETASDTRVQSFTTLLSLTADKNVDFGLTKNRVNPEVPDNSFSFSLSDVNAAIGYKTVSIETHSEIITYKTEYIETDTLYLGETATHTEGENGICESEYEISYADGVEISRKLVSSNITAEPKNEVILKGTKQMPSTAPTGTFIWPLDKGFVLSSRYKEVRSGFDTEYGYHLGLDLASIPVGAPVYAADGGKIIFADYSTSYGMMIKIQHENGVETRYAHLNKINVSVGDEVYQGQKIGEVGMTGRTTGPHLHFEVRIDDKTVNPEDYLPKK